MKERAAVSAVGFLSLPLAVAVFIATVLVIIGYFAIAMFGSLIWAWFPEWGFIAMVLLSPLVAYPFVMLARRLGRFIGGGV